jgi:hypothetical protein
VANHKRGSDAVHNAGAWPERERALRYREQAARFDQMVGTESRAAMRDRLADLARQYRRLGGEPRSKVPSGGAIVGTARNREYPLRLRVRREVGTFLIWLLFLRHGGPVPQSRGMAAARRSTAQSRGAHPRPGCQHLARSYGRSTRSARPQAGRNGAKDALHPPPPRRSGDTWTRDADGRGYRRLNSAQSPPRSGFPGFNASFAGAQAL